MAEQARTEALIARLRVVPARGEPRRDVLEQGSQGLEGIRSRQQLLALRSLGRRLMPVSRPLQLLRPTGPRPSCFPPRLLRPYEPPITPSFAPRSCVYGQGGSAQ